MVLFTDYNPAICITDPFVHDIIFCLYVGGTWDFCLHGALYTANFSVYSRACTRYIARTRAVPLSDSDWSFGVHEHHAVLRLELTASNMAAF